MKHRVGLLVTTAVLVVASSGTPALASPASPPAQIAKVFVKSGNLSLYVSFGAPNNNGSPITRYVATCNGNDQTVSASAPTSPVLVQNLHNNIFYTCAVRAVNAIGASLASYLQPGMPGTNFNKFTYTYCSPGGKPQPMALFRPKTTAPVPAILYVHSGGWNAGSLKDVNPSLLVTELTSRGFAFASIDYRLAPGVTPFDQERDVACAVRFLRAHAGQLGIAPTKIGAMGNSAGGNLVSLLGVDPPTVSATDQWPAQSNKVQAVVDLFGITEFGPDQMQIMPGLPTIFGTTDQNTIDSYGPVNYVTPDDPPFMIVHGIDDSIAPVHEGQDFYNLLRAAHVPVSFTPVANMGHEFQPVGGNLDPSLITLSTREVNFFTTYL